MREAILARGIEGAFTKPQILELYLNQIFLGRNAYGVQAASRAYFDKDVGELSLAEMAYLAVLPKAPNHYNQFRHHDRAMQRRNCVHGQLAENGDITGAERDAATDKPQGEITPTGSDVVWVTVCRSSVYTGVSD